MNKYGVKAKKGAIWSDFSVRFILRNPIYSGKNRWNWRSPVKRKAYTGAEIIKEIDQEGFEPIISEELFRETEKRMKERSYMAFRSDNYYPFSGVAKCAKCGHSYTGPFKKRRSRTIYRFYKCAGRCKFGICDSQVVVEESIENALLGMLELAKTELEFEDKNYYPTVDKNEIEKQLEKIKEKKERTKDLYIDGDLTKDQYKKRLEIFQEEEKELLSLLNKVDEDANIEEIKEILQNIKNEWHNMSYESKNTPSIPFFKV
ncbi:recombinase family protein [Fervidibacillus halotolerans]|uniref:Recombinase family protein n=1 Tax=Fervidibacillus halotolerans TaxID=2980027 RepID=A0A9E8LYF8_9BACI|nr:recombinase family protein [Fervidibacillus halotolerans]WAA11871.1 recombinase family protein [Fervidibacillus halotolerans]